MEQQLLQLKKVQQLQYLVDDSGVIINAGSGTKDNDLNINLLGNGTSDVATISAAGDYITLDINTGTNAIETVNLSGNGVATTYTVANGDAATF